MSWVAAAIIGSSVINGVLGSNAAGTAADAQIASSQQASQTQLQMFNQMQNNLQPYMQQGTLSLANLNNLMKNPNSITQMPGYQFQLGQGIDAIQNSASARGMTGNTLKELMGYGQGLASNYYNDAWGKLFNLTNMGENAAAGVGQAGISTGNSIAGNIIGAGNAQAAGAVGGASAISNALNGGIQNYMLYNMMNGG